MKTPRVELICVGSELLMGKVNTHAAALAPRLERLGLALRRETTVGDDPDEMVRAFREAWRRSDAVLCAGGLGPTFDDITREAWSKALRRPLRYVPSLARGIAAKFRARGLRMPPDNRRQAYLLSGARVLDNPNGTAPGQVLETGGKVLGLFPGPGRELFPLFDGDFSAILRRKFPGVARQTKIWRIYGIPESAVDEKLRPIVASEKSRDPVRVVWGILAQSFIIDIKATVSAPSFDEVENRLRRIELKIRRRFGRAVYGEGQETLEEAVGRLLRRRKETLAAAESCTGGLLAEKITRVPGSSDYFLQGVVTYSNESKRRVLGVKPATLARRGAVSRECAVEMARGARRRSGADWAVSVTGIAGPGGGGEKKPVGLVYIALSHRGRTSCREHLFFGDRQRIRERAALEALEALRLRLLSVR